MLGESVELDRVGRASKRPRKNATLEYNSHENKASGKREISEGAQKQRNTRLLEAEKLLGLNLPRET